MVRSVKVKGHHVNNMFFNFKIGVIAFKFAGLYFQVAMCMLKHSGWRGHDCLVCNKSFLNKHKLDQHMIVHTGLKLFQHISSSIALKQVLRSLSLSHQT